MRVARGRGDDRPLDQARREAALAAQPLLDARHLARRPARGRSRAGAAGRGAPARAIRSRRHGRLPAPGARRRRGDGDVAEMWRRGARRRRAAGAASLAGNDSTSVARSTPRQVAVQRAACGASLTNAIVTSPRARAGATGASHARAPAPERRAPRSRRDRSTRQAAVAVCERSGLRAWGLRRSGAVSGPRRSPPAVNCGVGQDDPLHQLVPDDVPLVEMDERDALDVPHDVQRFDQARTTRPFGRSIWVMSPVITAFEPKPRRVRNIFICSDVVFCASSRMTKASFERAAAHEGDRRDLDGAALEQRARRARRSSMS